MLEPVEEPGECERSGLGVLGCFILILKGLRGGLWFTVILDCSENSTGLGGPGCTECSRTDDPSNPENCNCLSGAEAAGILDGPEFSERSECLYPGSVIPNSDESPRLSFLKGPNSSENCPELDPDLILLWSEGDCPELSSARKQ